MVELRELLAYKETGQYEEARFRDRVAGRLGGLQNLHATERGALRAMLAESTDGLEATLPSRSLPKGTPGR